MDNYMFGAAQNARSFLMQPQLERERVQDRTRRNAMADWQFEQAQAQAQAQAEAARREQERQRRMATGGAVALGLPQRLSSGEIVPSSASLGGMRGAASAGAPAPMGGPPAPLQGGAPAMSTVPNQGTAQPGMIEQIDPATGQPVGVVTVTGQGAQRVQPWEGLRQVTQKEVLERQLADAWAAGDYEHFNQLNTQYWGMMTEDERAGWQRLGATAAFILQQPPEARSALVRQALQEYNIDPSQTQLDDLLGPGNELALEQALVGTMARGAPAEANKEGIRVFGTEREFRRPQLVNQGNQQSLVSMSGTNPGEVLGTFQVQADPNAVLSAQTQRRGQDVQAQIARERNASAQRIAGIQASTTMSEGEKNRAIRREQMASQERVAVLTGRTIGEDEELGSYVDNPEF